MSKKRQKKKKLSTGKKWKERKHAYNILTNPYQVQTKKKKKTNEVMLQNPIQKKKRRQQYVRRRCLNPWKRRPWASRVGRRKKLSRERRIWNPAFDLQKRTPYRLTQKKVTTDFTPEYKIATNTSAVSSADWVVDTQLWNLRDMSGSGSFVLYFICDLVLMNSTLCTR